MPRRKIEGSGSTAGDKPTSDVKRTKVEIPDLVWQTEADNGAWVTFTKENNDTLCGSCLNDKQATIKIDGDEVTVIFAKMIKKKKSGYSQRIRCAVKSKDTSDYFSWSWFDAKKKINHYTAESCLLLEEAKHDGKDSVTVGIGAISQEIDLADMEYTKGKTVGNVERNKIVVKSESVDSGIASASSADVNSQTKDDGKKKKPDAKIKKEVSVKDEIDSKIQSKSGAKGKSGAAKSTGSNVGKSGVARVVVMNGKGKAPVDAECSSLADKAHVFCEGKDVWDCMLNQTNVGNNNNKYYLIQLLEEHSRPSYHVWQRWGRVGYKGQNNLVPCGPDLNKAKAIFTKKFSDKTKNDWDGRDFFEKYPGKYDLLAMDYSTKGSDETDASADIKEPIKYPDCSLDSRLQALIKLICDVKHMEQVVIEMEYDAKKAPLGKLTGAQIKAGYLALKSIAELIEKGDLGTKLTQACSDFYTRIPHNFGVRRCRNPQLHVVIIHEPSQPTVRHQPLMRPPTTIRTEQEVKLKLQLLEALDDIEIAIRTLKEGDHSENPIDRHYKALNCDLMSLDKDHTDFKILERYLHDTHATTHNMYSMQLLDIFSCHREMESSKFNDCGNRMLLWHGSRLTNWVGIFTKGLRIAPPEAPVTGYMFGKGVYFADMSSKSANYCFATSTNNIGMLLLCDVALGTSNDLLSANINAHKLPSNKHSVKGLGKIAPDPTQHTKLSDGVMVPSGKGVSTGVNNPHGYTLQYNEYIVYNTDQIRMRYVLKVKFNFKK